MVNNNENLNLTINPLLRQIDTVMHSSKSGGQPLAVYELLLRVRDLMESLITKPDLEIPNNAFIGVSNETRKMVIGSFAAIVIQELEKSLSNLAKGANPKGPEHGTN